MKSNRMTMIGALATILMFSGCSGGDSENASELAHEFYTVTCDRMLECSPEAAMFFGSTVSECVSNFEKAAAQNEGGDDDSGETDCPAPDMNAYNQCLSCMKTSTCEGLSAEPSVCDQYCTSICPEDETGGQDTTPGGSDVAGQGQDTNENIQGPTNQQLGMAGVYCNKKDECEHPDGNHDTVAIAACVATHAPTFCEEYTAMALVTCQQCLGSTTCTDAAANSLPACAATDCGGC